MVLRISSLVSYDALFPTFHGSSFAPTRLHCVLVSVRECVCFIARARLNDSRMSFSPVVCVSDHRSMYVCMHSEE